MARNHKDSFISVKIEGALLSPDLLERIVITPEEVEGLSPSDYHLAGNERLNEAINRSWNRMTALWQAFLEARNHLTESDWATGMTRERWLLPLFHELGYGRLVPSKAEELDGKSYPISHAWQNSPIHLLGCRLPLDRRTAGVAGAATMNPHSLVQKFLNRSDEHLWGLVSNGLTLRILRDNASISRQQYVEFDLEGIMEGELYADFVLLWLLCHQSRFEAENPADCWLERWGQTVQEEGSRVLERLRDGVKDAIVSLGQGFLEHPANGNLREALQSGHLDRQDYFRQILRLVYRLIFLCTTEDRGLLFAHGISEQARSRYEKYYSLRRLRDLAEKRRGSNHHDLYQQLKMVMASLGQANGAPALGLPALGSFLWSDRAMPEVMESEIRNRELLSALRSLTLHQTGERRIRVDFRHLGAEEMGSVYESLLELHPELHIEARKFELKEAAGSERKTTGSYYTPTSLINCLLDLALDPVLEEAAQQVDPEEAILNLKICDPACGSGQFLVGAARRVAYRLAAIRCGEDDPAPEHYRAALRQVIARCIYGVDINEMAVELCQVNLWLESLEPGMPLCFLDHHIKCGNSLLGTTPALLAKGIPDEAFAAIEGDDKRDVSALKRQNRQEKEGQWGLFDCYIPNGLGLMSQHLRQIDAVLEKDFKEQTEKEKRYNDLLGSAGYCHQVLYADAWCAAFIWLKDYKKIKTALTQSVLNTLKRDPNNVDAPTIAEIERLSRQYQFFHWHLAFPDVFYTPPEKQKPENASLGWSGGFDIVLGNPPWERIKLQEKEWFASIVPEIAEAPNSSTRRRLIAKLAAESPGIYSAFSEDRRKAEGESHFSRNSGYFPLCGRGDINTYAVFAELMRNLIGSKGRVGCIVPSGIASDDTTKFFFQNLIESESLVALYGFENEARLFLGVDHRVKFALLTMAGLDMTIDEFDFVFFAREVHDLKETVRHFTLNREELILLNPNTLTCPVFRSRRDAELTKSIYRRVPVFIKEGPVEENPWGIRFATMFHMSNDSHLFRTQQQMEDQGFRLEGNVFRKDRNASPINMHTKNREWEYVCNAQLAGSEGQLDNFDQDCFLPLYEAKMVHQYDHRFGTYVGQTEAQANQGKLPELNVEQHSDPTFLPFPRYWVDERQVVARISDVPRLLANAWLKWEAEEIASALKPWIAGFFANRNVSTKPIGRLFQLLPVISDKDERVRIMERRFPFRKEEMDTIANMTSITEAADYLVRTRCPRWLLGFRDITSAVTSRTAISTIIPLMGVGNNLPLVLHHSKTHFPLIIANLSSYILDFVARFKVGGNHMNFFITSQLPVLPPQTYDEICAWYQRNILEHWLFTRVMELTYTSWDLSLFAKDCGYEGPPFRWNEERRFQIRCELDAAYFHLYGIARDDVDYIMDTFPIVKRKDEANYGSYRTKETILAIYNQMQAAIDSGQPYQTPLNPPPGPPEVWPLPLGTPSPEHIHSE
ncbi:MAG: N-6 DNA methylase [Syntrophomonas sp.]